MNQRFYECIFNIFAPFSYRLRNLLLINEIKMFNSIAHKIPSKIRLCHLLLLLCFFKSQFCSNKLSNNKNVQSVLILRCNAFIFNIHSEVVDFVLHLSSLIYLLNSLKSEYIHMLTLYNNHTSSHTNGKTSSNEDITHDRAIMRRNSFFFSFLTMFFIAVIQSIQIQSSKTAIPIEERAHKQQ